MAISVRVIDDDKDEIMVVNKDTGQSIRSWEYRDEPERRRKMLMAREFVEGWFQASNCKNPVPDKEPK